MQLDVMDWATMSALLQPPLPDDVWRSWNWDPLLVLGLLLSATLYGRGVWRLWQRAGPRRGVSYGQAVAFFGGLLSLAVALVSPLEALSSALLAAHMVQHLLLMLVAAPLLVWGMSPVAMAWSLNSAGPLPGAAMARWWHRQGRLRRWWRAASRLPVAWVLHNGVLWLWHTPALYEAAIVQEWVHTLEHVMFLGAAVFFWWVVDDRGNGTQMARVNADKNHANHGNQRPIMRRPAVSGRHSAAGVLYVFTTALLSGLLGVLLTFSQRVWYPVYGVAPYGWGLTPLQDQQLAGVIMWFPGGLVYLAATVLLLFGALQRRGIASGPARAVVAPEEI